MIGDKDPEDAWDDGDPFETRLRLLERILEDLRANRDERFDARRLDALRLARKLEAELDPAARLKRIKRELERL